MRHVRVALGGALMGLLLAGCFPVGSEGELSNGAFAYDCFATQNDAFCDDAIVTFNGETTLPSAIAVGATFDVRYGGEKPETEDGVSFSVSVVPASEVMIERDGTKGFRAKTPGEAALLGRGSEGTVADFVHIHLGAVEHIDITSLGATLAAVGLAPGGSVDLSATPADSDGDTLGGSLSYVWTSDDPSIATVSAKSGDNEATLHAEAAGTTTLRIAAGGAETLLPITVEAP